VGTDCIWRWTRPISKDWFSKLRFSLNEVSVVPDETSATKLQEKVRKHSNRNWVVYLVQRPPCLLALKLNPSFTRQEQYPMQYLESYKLQHASIIYPIKFSKWAAPIFQIMKKGWYIVDIIRRILEYG